MRIANTILWVYKLYYTFVVLIRSRSYRVYTKLPRRLLLVIIFQSEIWCLTKTTNIY